MKDVALHWLRDSRSFVVRDRRGRDLVVGITDLFEAFEIAEAEQRAIVARRAAAAAARAETKAAARFQTARKVGRVIGSGMWR